MLKAKEAIEIPKPAKNTISKKNERLKNFFYFFFKIERSLQSYVLENKNGIILSILSFFFEEEKVKSYHKYHLATIRITTPYKFAPKFKVQNNVI